MDKQFVDEVLRKEFVDTKEYRYIKGERTRDHRRFTVIERLPLPALDTMPDASAWEVVEEIHKEPLYDQETFEDMIWDYCSDHVDSDFDGEYPEIDREGIIYDEIEGYWEAYCKFASDDNWYTLIGDNDGNVTLYY